MSAAQQELRERYKAMSAAQQELRERYKKACEQEYEAWPVSYPTKHRLWNRVCKEVGVFGTSWSEMSIKDMKGFLIALKAMTHKLNNNPLLALLASIEKG